VSIMVIDVIDVGAGNVVSVKNWIERCNIAANIVNSTSQLRSEMVVLPGVGSAGPFMELLRKNNFDTALKDHVSSGKRTIGICLGFQLMMDYSEEDGAVQGLGLLSGHVERLRGVVSHNGWEPFQLKRSDLKETSIRGHHNLTRKQVLHGRVFYNHEYGVVSREASAFSLTVSTELSDYSGLVIKDNIIGLQFHPEKSQRTGADLLTLLM